MNDFRGILFLNISRKSVEKSQVSLTSDKNKGYFVWSHVYIYDNISEFLLKWEMFQTDVEKIKTFTLCSVILTPENRAVTR